MYGDNNNYNIIALLPTNGDNYSIIGYDNNNKVHIDEEAEFSIKLSPKGIVSQVGICSLEKDYLIISISRINIVQEYFFNNIYVLCDDMEELIFSNRSMPEKTYSNINSKIGLYLPKSQNRKVSIGLDFHQKNDIHNPKYTTLNYTELIKMYDKRITFSSYTKNTVTFDFSFSENIPVNVELSNNYYNKYETLSRVLNVNINDRVGKFSIVSLAKEQYIVLDLLLSDNLTVDKNDILLIFDNCIIPLSDEMKIITEKIYIFPGSKVYNNRIKIPIRFQTVYSTFKVSYAIAKYHETKDLTLNTEGETITFSSTKTAYAFVIPYFKEYFREDLVINSYTTYKVKKYLLEIEYSALLLVVIHENPNCPNQLIFALNRLTIPKYQLKLAYNTKFMKKFFPPNQIEYKVYIYSDNDYVKYIRYNNNYSMCKNYYKMLAVFTFNEVVFLIFMQFANMKEKICVNLIIHLDQMKLNTT